jgi:hypothetical protein
MFRRPSPAMILAIFALVAGLAGSASAAKSLITGKQIKDRSIALKDLSPAARKALRGQIGPIGASGPAGIGGPTGPTGATGPSDAFSASGADIDIPDTPDPTTTVLHVDVPAGSYVIQAHAFLNNPTSPAQIDCRLEAGAAVDEGRQDLDTGTFANDQEINHLLTATVTAPTTIRWKCTDGGVFDVRMFDARLVAIKVGSLTGS